MEGLSRRVSRESKATAVTLLLAWVAIGALSLTIALIVAPAFALLFVLSLGFFPGEGIVQSIRERSRPREWSRPVVLSAPSQLNFVRRTGFRLAFALAVRPPPIHR